jgi:hypothetical protein
MGYGRISVLDVIRIDHAKLCAAASASLSFEAWWVEVDIAAGTHSLLECPENWQADSPVGEWHLFGLRYRISCIA